MNYRFSSRVSQLKSSVVRNIEKMTQSLNMISFADGLPTEDLFPIQAVREAAELVYATGPSALQFDRTEGYLPLKEQLKGHMASKGMHVTLDQMILTTGSQQAIDLLIRVLTEPGDTILVENPTSMASLDVFTMHGLTVLTSECDEFGINPEDAERIIRKHRPKLLYAVPTFGNPTGRVWSLERRKRMLALCKQYQMLIIEDDLFGDISFDPDTTYPTIFSLEGRAENGSVFYTSSFSNTIAPALKTGWAIGDSRVIGMAAQAKQAIDLHPSTIDQQILSQMLKHKRFNLEDHFRLISKAYGERMQEMHERLSNHGLPDVTWIKPRGGMFLWLELPEGLDAEALLRCSIPKGVAFLPGSTFYAQNPQRNTARLNYTLQKGERMEQGIERFVEAINEFTARS